MTQLTLNEYQAEAMSFRLPTADIEYVRQNIVGELGEYFSLLAKARRDGIPYEFDMLVKKELGDILWHVAALAIDQGYTLEDIAESNLAKLSARKAKGTIKGSGDNR